MNNENFNAQEIDAIGEIMNISMGASATAVSNMLGAEVHITTPVVKTMNKNDFEFKRLQPAVGVEIAYDEGLYGKNIMMFSREDVRIIVGILMGTEFPPEDFVLDEMNTSAICEVMNQMMGASATSLSEFLGRMINITTPVSFEIDNEAIFKEKYFEDDNGDEEKVIVSFDLEVKDKIKSEFLNIMSLDFVRELLSPIINNNPELLGLDTPAEIGRETAEKSSDGENESGDKLLNQDAINKMLSEATPEEPPKKDAPLSQEAINNMLNSSANEPVKEEKTVDTGAALSQDEINKMMETTAKAEQVEKDVTQTLSNQQSPNALGGGEAALYQMISQLQASQMQMMNCMKEMQTAPTQRDPRVVDSLKEKEFTEKMTSGTEISSNREMLLNVPLDISVEIGRTKRNVREILELTNGSLVVLDKMAGEQADLFVNGRCIARGDIVVVEDNFGIRITEIITKDIAVKEEI